MSSDEQPSEPGIERGIERLSFMLGSFRGEERGSAGQVSTGRLEAKLAVGGLAVVSDYVQSVDSAPVFSGHGVYTFDGRDQHYVMTWFDSEGGGRPVVARGGFEGSRLTFAADGERGQSRYLYDVRDDGYDFAISVSTDGVSWRPVLEASYTRA